MKKHWVKSGLLSGLLLAAPMTGSAQNPPGLGDGNDGSRSGPIHLITLYDERGLQIKPGDDQPWPISMRKTCGECHDYELISKGWHFHSGTTNRVDDGRRGEPWVLSDSATRTQIPVSNRHWQGTYSPAQLNLSPWKFLKDFSSHFPGGNYGEMPPAEDDQDADPVEFLRWPISGQYEINCLACHNADPRQDQSLAALQAARENYRWAATAAAGLGEISGTAFELDEFYDPEFDYKIITKYDANRFDNDNKVFLDLVRKPPANRCYFCHSTQDMQTGEELDWILHEDIHLSAGMTCVDCHRNGDDHMMTRGYEELTAGDPKAPSAFSCRGCHMGDESSEDPSLMHGGHLGAPYPEHAGLPPIHLDKLSCTACHSGPYPGKTPVTVRTSRIHKLALHGKHHADIKLPHVMTPVFVRGENGKIQPHNMFWPAYWGTLEDDKLTPIHPQVIKELAPEALGLDQPSDARVNDWRTLNDEQIAKILRAIADRPEQETKDKPVPVYVAGGKLYRLANDKLISEISTAAEPYSWPIGHDVRPATQSLGANGRCTDCHDTSAPFLFGQVPVDSPLVTKKQSVQQAKSMVDFQSDDQGYRGYHETFSRSFVFRPWMKGVVIGACGIVGLVILAFLIKGIGWIAMATGKERETS